MEKYRVLSQSGEGRKVASRHPTRRSLMEVPGLQMQMVLQGGLADLGPH